MACGVLGIPYIAAVPFVGQESKWSRLQIIRWQRLLKGAQEIVLVSEGGYAPWKLQRRNEWMVDNATRVLALWDGSSGGTKNCLDYARKMKKPIDNLWHEWEQRGS